MKLYYCDGFFFSTLSEAKKQANLAAGRSYDGINVDRVEVATTKDNVLRMLNGESGVMETITMKVYSAKPKLKAGN